MLDVLCERGTAKEKTFSRTSLSWSVFVLGMVIYKPYVSFSICKWHQLENHPLMNVFLPKWWNYQSVLHCGLLSLRTFNFPSIYSYISVEKGIHASIWTQMEGPRATLCTALMVLFLVLQCFWRNTGHILGQCLTTLAPKVCQKQAALMIECICSPNGCNPLLGLTLVDTNLLIRGVKHITHGLRTTQ